MNTNEPMTQERLDAIQARVEVATDGPWAVDSDDPSYIIYSERGGWDGLVIAQVADQDGALFSVEHNGALIAHAREDVPALLAEVERLRALTTVDDDMVERAALVLGNRRHRGIHRGWDGATSAERDGWRDEARAALNAAFDTGEEA